MLAYKRLAALELVVIDALYNYRKGDLANNFMRVLNFIASNITTVVYKDPANTNNCISDQITSLEKSKIAQQAKLSASKHYWSEIVS